MTKSSNLKQAKKKMVAILTTTIIVLVVLIAVGVFAFFTNGFQGDFSTYYLTCDNEVYKLDNSKQIQLKKGKTYNFSVKNILEKVEDTKIEYSVKIVAQTFNYDDFVLYNNEELIYFSQIGEVSQYFSLKSSENTFSFKVPSDFTFKNCLASKFGDTLKLNEKIINLRDISYFKLVFDVFFRLILLTCVAII